MPVQYRPAQHHHLQHRPVQHRTHQHRTARPSSALRRSALRRALLLFLAAVLAASASAQLPADPRSTTLDASTTLVDPRTLPDHPATRAASPVAVDGQLSEAAWEEAEAIPVAWEWYPGDNVAAPVDTVALVTFDDDHLYVAFRAHDPDPSAVRAHLADRDTAFDDDLVGFLVDPFADRRRALRFQVNPLGVQMDAQVSDLDDSTDWSWDAIWDSAGRITADGWVVEMAVPWKQLRFPRELVEAGPRSWGFLAIRDYPRSAEHQLRSVPRDHDRDCFVCQFGSVAGFTGVTPGVDVEIQPTVTASRSDRREAFPDGPLVDGDGDAEAGITARWGITPAVSLGATVNPDFSQVEADAARLDVNERFALFFPERRPFFLEGADVFGTPLPVVFTRTIADPAWGAKLTGKEGAHGFGVLVARDELNNLIFPGNQGSSSTSLEQDVDAAVARYRRDVGEGSSLGLLYTGRDATGYQNQVAGVDGLWRLGNRDAIRFQGLGSRTEYPGAVARDFGQPRGGFDGHAVRLRYDHGERDWAWFASYDDVGSGFRADTGFLPRVDVRRARAGVERVWRGGEEGDWFDRFEVFLGGDTTRDQAGDVREWGADLVFTWEGAGQTVVSYALAPNDEYFDGVNYDDFRQSLFFATRPSGALGVSTGLNWGEQIDFANSRQAEFVRLTPEVDFNLGRHVEGVLGHLWQRTEVDLVREGGVERGAELFEAHISELRLLYHFDRRSYLRAIVQHDRTDFNPEAWTFEVDPEERDLFLQLLFSYKLNPRTLLLAGYSDSYRGGTPSAAPALDLTRTGRAFFLKVGYAFLF